MWTSNTVIQDIHVLCQSYHLGQLAVCTKTATTVDMKLPNAAVSMLKIDPYIPGVQLRGLLIHCMETDIHIDEQYIDFIVEDMHYIMRKILKMTKSALRMVCAWLQNTSAQI